MIQIGSQKKVVSILAIESNSLLCYILLLISKFTALKLSSTFKKYPAYTLLEMLVVMGILVILGGMTFSAFDGLQNTVKMNEYVLNLEQDIRNVQRASMLLQRDSGERWIYGLGIDFSEVTEDGDYRTFKWCSPFSDYGDVRTKSKLPAYNPSMYVDDTNAHLPDFSEATYSSSTCPLAESESEVKNLPGYVRSTNPPKGVINILGAEDYKVNYVLFESVSGRTFFYNLDGDLLNYTSNGDPIENPVNFELEITPFGKGSTRKIVITNLSGKITSYMYD